MRFAHFIAFTVVVRDLDGSREVRRLGAGGAVEVRSFDARRLVLIELPKAGATQVEIDLSTPQPHLP